MAYNDWIKSLLNTSDENNLTQFDECVKWCSELSDACTEENYIGTKIYGEVVDKLGNSINGHFLKYKFPNDLEVYMSLNPNVYMMSVGGLDNVPSLKLWEKDKCGYVQMVTEAKDDPLNIPDKNDNDYNKKLIYTQNQLDFNYSCGKKGDLKKALENDLVSHTINALKLYDKIQDTIKELNKNEVERVNIENKNKELKNLNRSNRDLEHKINKLNKELKYLNDYKDLNNDE